jgi:hypothetical protein
MGQKCTEPECQYTFFYGKEDKKYELGAGSLYVRESYQQLRRYCLLVIVCRTQN